MRPVGRLFFADGHLKHLLRESGFRLEPVYDRDALRLFHVPTGASVDIGTVELMREVEPLKASVAQTVAALIRLAYRRLMEQRAETTLAEPATPRLGTGE